jgi:hypothetical protein
MKIMLRRSFLFRSDQQYATNELSDEDDMMVLWMQLNEFKSLGIQLHVSYFDISSQCPRNLFDVSPLVGSFMVMIN